MKQYQRKFSLGVLWVLSATMGRIVPHPPNVTPLTSLSVLAGTEFKLKHSWLFTFLSLVLSDILLAFIQGHAAFGLWSLFTYSGYLMITACSAYASRNVSMTSKLGHFTFLWICTGLSEIGYWVWTNFGTWMITAIYPHTLLGLMHCYIAGIPFLRNALLGSLVWVSVLSVVFLFYIKRVDALVQSAEILPSR